MKGILARITKEVGYQIRLIEVESKDPYVPVTQIGSVEDRLIKTTKGKQQ
jgi:hypothetical protein